MSLVLMVGWALCLFARSRVGDTRAATLEDDAAGTAKDWL